MTQVFDSRKRFVLDCNYMPTIVVDESKQEFFYYLRRLFKKLDKKVDPLRDYSTYEIFIIKSTSKTKKVKVYGALITAK